MAFLSEEGGGNGEASERATGQGKICSGMGESRRVKIHCCIDGFSAAGPGRRNRRDESAEFPPLWWYPSFLRSMDGAGEGRAAENDRVASVFLSFRGRKRCNTKIDFPQRRGRKKREKGARDPGEVLRVCAGLHQVILRKFRLMFKGCTGAALATSMEKSRKSPNLRAMVSSALCAHTGREEECERRGQA